MKFGTFRLEKLRFGSRWRWNRGSLDLEYGEVVDDLSSTADVLSLLTEGRGGEQRVQRLEGLERVLSPSLLT